MDSDLSDSDNFSESLAKQKNDICKILLGNPDKCAMVLELLKNQPFASGKNSPFSNKKSRPLKRLQKNGLAFPIRASQDDYTKKVDSPSAMLRKRMLQKLDSESSSDDLENRSLISSVDAKPIDTILKGVVIYCEVKINGEYRSDAIKAILRSMGATVRDCFTRDVTHVIFKDGSYKTYQKAKLLDVHLVSVLWVEAVRKYKMLVPESLYPIVGEGVRKANMSMICQQMEQDFNETVKEEYKCQKEGKQKFSFSGKSAPLWSDNSIISCNSDKARNNNSRTLLDSDSDCSVESNPINKRKSINTIKRMIHHSTSLSTISEMDHVETTQTTEKIKHSTPIIPKTKNTKAVNDKSKHIDVSPKKSVLYQKRLSKFKANGSPQTLPSPVKRSRNTLGNLRDDSLLPVSSSVIPRRSSRMSINKTIVDDDNVIAPLRQNRRKTIASYFILNDTSKLSDDLLETNKDDNIELTKGKPENASDLKENDKNGVGNLQRKSSIDLSDQYVNKGNRRFRKLYCPNQSVDSVFDDCNNESILSGVQSPAPSATPLRAKTEPKNRILKRHTEVNGCRTKLFDNATDKEETTDLIEKASKGRKSAISNGLAPPIKLNVPKQSRSRKSVCVTNKNEDSDKPVAALTETELFDSSTDKSETTDLVVKSSKSRKSVLISNSIASPIKPDVPKQSRSRKSVCVTNKNEDSDKPVATLTETELFDSSTDKSETTDLVVKSSKSRKSVLISTPIKQSRSRKSVCVTNNNEDNDKPITESTETIEDKPSSDLVVKSSKSRKSVMITNAITSPIKPDIPKPPRSRKSVCATKKKEDDKPVATLPETIEDKPETNINNISKPTESPQISKVNKTIDNTGSPRSSLNNSRDSTQRNIPSIVCTHFHKADVQVFQQIVTKLGGFIVEDEVTAKTTHLVAAGPSRTLNMLRAVSRGCWVVNKEWLYKSLEVGEWLKEEDYELTEFSPSVQENRLEKQVAGSRFAVNTFTDCGNLYVSRSSTPRCSDLEELITLCGGTVVKTLHKADILIGEFDDSRDVKCVSEKWIMDCITYNKIKSMKNYMISRRSSFSY